MRTVILDSATLVPQTVVNFSKEVSKDNLLPIDKWDIDAQKLSECVSQLTCFSFTSNEQVLEHSKDAEIIITNKVSLTSSILKQLPRLKLIVIAATGTNNIDLAAAQSHNIRVSNVQNYSTPSVVQNCFVHILNLSSQLTQVTSALSQQGWHNQPQFVLLPTAYNELNGKTLGVIGHGTIGKAVAGVAHAFGMKTLIAQLEHRPFHSDRVPLEKFLPQCDIVSLHCPQVTQTEKLINQDFLSQMKPSAFLINTARGGLIDETHLANALRSKTIAGAGLDVLSTEPPSANNPLLASDIPNLHITPHIGWASRESRQRLIEEIAKNINAYIEGRSRNIVA